MEHPIQGFVGKTVEEIHDKSGNYLIKFPR